MPPDTHPSTSVPPEPAQSVVGTVPIHRVLLVDGDPLVRATISACLRRAGFVVHEASDGRKAHTFLNHRSVEALIGPVAPG